MAIEQTSYHRPALQIGFIAIVAALLGTQSFAATVNVYVGAGSSNSIGVQDVPYTPVAADSVVRFYPELGTITNMGRDLTEREYPPGDDPDDARWVQVVPRVEHNLAPIEFRGVLRSGHEIAFGRLIYNKFGLAHNPVIAKFGIGASSIERHWLNSPTMDLLDRMILFLSQLRRIVEDNGDTFVIRSFYWNQGESDTSSQSDADKYLANLRQLVAKVRNFSGNPKLPVMVARTHISLATMPVKDQQLRTAPLATVRAAQVRFVQTDRCAALVNMDDLTHSADSVHFQPPAYAVIGQRAYQGLTNILSRPACQ